MQVNGPRTIMVALSHMSWAVLQARLGAGSLPALALAATRGCRAPIAAPSELGPVGIWTTVATGRSGRDHGVISAQEIWPGGMRPAGHASWRAAPFWERLESAGVGTIGVGWPAIRPGAAWSGIQVDDRLGEPNGKTWDEWLTPPDIAPEAVRADLLDSRVHPTDLAFEQLRPFVPGVESVDQYRDKRLVELALPLARFSTDFAAFSQLLARDDWQVATLHVALVEHLVARFEGAPAPFDRVIEAAHMLVDSAIGALMARLRAEETLLVVATGQAGTAGFVVACGPGLAAGTMLPPLRTIDVAPSLLARCGVAQGDLPGAARLGGEAPLRTPDQAWSPSPPVLPDEDDLARVRAFGFAGAPISRELQALHIVDWAQHCLIDRPGEARRLAQQALDLAPDSLAALGALAAACAMDEDFEALDGLAGQMEAIAPEHCWTALIRAGWHASRKEIDRAEPLLRRVAADGGALEWGRAAAAWLMLGRPDEARQLFARVLSRWPDSVGALLGFASTGLDRTDPREIAANEQALRRALMLDPGNAEAEAGLRKLAVRRATAPKSGAERVAIQT